MPISVDVRQPKSILKDRNVHTVTVKPKVLNGKRLVSAKSCSTVPSDVNVRKCATNREINTDTDAVPRKFDLLHVYAPVAHRFEGAVDEFAVPEPSLLFEESNLHIEDELPSRRNEATSPLALSPASSPVKVGAPKQVAESTPNVANDRRSTVTASNDGLLHRLALASLNQSQKLPTAIETQTNSTSSKECSTEDKDESPRDTVSVTAPSSSSSSEAREENASSKVTTGATTTATATATAQPPLAVGPNGPAPAYPFLGYPAWQPQSYYAAMNAYWLNQLQQHASGYPTPMQLPLSGIPGYFPVRAPGAYPPAANVYPQDAAMQGINSPAVAALLANSPNTHMYRLLVEQDRQLKQLQKQVAQLLNVSQPTPTPQVPQTQPAPATTTASADQESEEQANNRDVQTMTTSTNTTIMWQQTTTTTTRTTMTTLIEQQASGTPKKNGVVISSRDSTPRKTPLMQNSRAITHEPTSSTPDDSHSVSNGARQAQTRIGATSRLFDDRRRDDSLFESEAEDSESDSAYRTKQVVRKTAASDADDEMPESSTSDDVRLASESSTSIELPRRCEVNANESDLPVFAIADDIGEPTCLRRDQEAAETSQCADENKDSMVDRCGELPKLVQIELPESFRSDQAGSTSLTTTSTATVTSSANRQLEVSCGALLERINVLLNSSVLRSGTSSTCEPSNEPVAAACADMTAVQEVVCEKDAEVIMYQTTLNDASSSPSPQQSWMAATNESVNVDVLLTKHRLFMLEAASGHLRTNASTLSVNTTQSGASFVDVLDSLALKYLDDAELSRLTRELNASATVGVNESRISGSPAVANLTLFGMNANNVSFATKRYLEKHRLIVGSSNDREKTASRWIPDSTHVEEVSVDTPRSACDQARNYGNVKTGETETVCSSIGASNPISSIAFESASSSVRVAEANSIQVTTAYRQSSSTPSHQPVPCDTAFRTSHREGDRERLHRHHRHHHHHHRSSKTATAGNDSVTAASSSSTVASSTITTSTASVAPNCAVELTESSRTKSSRDERRERRHTHSHAHKRSERRGEAVSQQAVGNGANLPNVRNGVIERVAKWNDQAGCAAPAVESVQANEACEQDLACRVLDISRIKQLPKLM